MGVKQEKVLAVPRKCSATLMGQPKRLKYPIRQSECGSEVSCGTYGKTYPSWRAAGEDFFDSVSLRGITPHPYSERRNGRSRKLVSKMVQCLGGRLRYEVRTPSFSTRKCRFEACPPDKVKIEGDKKMKHLKVVSPKRLNNFRVKLCGRRFVIKIFEPHLAQKNLIGYFGDGGSCFRPAGENHHHPGILEKNGWKFCAIYEYGKNLPHSRSWIKVNKNSILVINVYTRSGNGDDFDLHLMILMSAVDGELKKTKHKVVDEDIYTNGGKIYVIRIRKGK